MADKKVTIDQVFAKQRERNLAASLQSEKRIDQRAAEARREFEERHHVTVDRSLPPRLEVEILPEEIALIRTIAGLGYLVDRYDAVLASEREEDEPEAEGDE